MTPIKIYYFKVSYFAYMSIFETKNYIFIRFVTIITKKIIMVILTLFKFKVSFILQNMIFLYKINNLFKKQSDI